MNLCYHIHSSVLKLPHFFTPKSFMASHRRELRVFTVATTTEEASAGGVTAAGMYAGFRASGKKPNLALVTCDVGAVAAVANTFLILFYFFCWGVYNECGCCSCSLLQEGYWFL
ncbi:unnamed protein product [Brassica oleracea var. botrytis]